MIGIARRIERLPRPVVVVALLAVFAAQVIHSMRQECSTFDETTHLVAGYSYLATGDFRMNAEHPPLAKMLGAFPLRLLPGVQFSTDWPEWRTNQQYSLGARFLYVANDADSLLFWGRLPLLMLACLLGVCVYAWACEIRGRVAGALALLLFVFTPELLAHAPLVATDVPLAAFAFIAFYAFWRCLRQCRLLDATIGSVAFGAALATKHNAVVFLPLLAAALASRVVAATPWSVQLTPRASPRALRTRCARAGFATGVAVYAALWACSVVWLAYGLQGGLPRGSAASVFDWNSIHPESAILQVVASAARSFRILPELYTYGLFKVLDRASSHPSFILGEYDPSGPWHRLYFLVSYAVKTPIPQLLLELGGVAIALAAFRRGQWKLAMLVAPAVLHLVVCLQADVNIGNRHLIPMLPFLLVLAAVASVEALLRPWSRVLLGGALAWLVWGTASVAPHYLAYFNELVGGPRGGIHVLVDSNLDWGQDLPGLKRWMDGAGVKKVHLSYFGSALPDYYGIDYTALPSVRPLPKPISYVLDVRETPYVAVSATNLQKPYLAHFRAPPAFLAFLDELRTREVPVAVIGGSIYVYRLASPRR